ncbi:MAG TPA: hypothetical protein VEQ63_04210 [Bryobacteraceae bacterium]|nr:hypothetical protein [Bryobacteraceae bacterium]
MPDSTDGPPDASSLVGNPSDAKALIRREVASLRPLVLLVALLTSFAAAYSQKLEVEMDTLEGQALQKIDAEMDPAKKLTLMQAFAKEFPNHEAVTWVLGRMQATYLEAKQYEKVLEVGTRILSLDPMELTAAQLCLKAAEGRKDLPLIKLWSGQTFQLAKRVAQSQRPEYGDETDIAQWKARIEYARQVEQYTEYALYFASLQTTDAKLKSNLIETLESRNPMSEYLAQMRTAHTSVVRQVDIEEAVAAAETQFRQGEYSEDALLMVATHLMQRRRDPEKVIAYSDKLIELLATRGKPEAISEAEWDGKKRNMLGTAHWMAGVLSSTLQRFGAADRHLRAALPYLRNNEMIAGAYYHLGFVNFRIAETGERIRIHDAIRFTKECLAINSAVQFQASENLKAMKAEYGLQE